RLHPHTQAWPMAEPEEGVLMFQRIVTLAVAVGLTLVTAGAVQANDHRGKVVRMDPDARVVVLDDGRMFRMAPDTVFLVEEKPVTFETIRPGASVVIRSGEPVEFREGRYIVVNPSAS